MKLKSALLLSSLVLTGCSALQRPASSDVAAYCTPENAFRLGSESRAYFGNCPKEREGAFLAALERGRGYQPPTPSVYPYMQQIRATEKDIVSASSEADRDRLRVKLTELEWWAVHLMTSPGSYGGDGR